VYRVAQPRCSRPWVTGSLLVDGSFVMLAVDQPEDLDLVLVLTEE
jgi:hypothetical protein